MDCCTATLALLVLTACGAVVTPADDTSSGDDTTSVPDPSDPASGGSQVDSDSPTGDGPPDDGSSTDAPPACEDPPAPQLATHALGNFGSRVSDVLVADLNDDGRAELVLASPTLETLHVIDGTAPLDLAAASVIETRGVAFAIAAGDFDIYPMMDLVVGHADGSLELMIGDGVGGFQSLPTPHYVADDLVDVQFGDFDGDGGLDAVVLGNAADGGRVWWLRGGGEEQIFATAENLLTQHWPQANTTNLAVIPDAKRPGAHAAVVEVRDNDEHWIALLRPGEAPEAADELPHSTVGVAVGHFDGDDIHDIAALGTETSEIFRITGEPGGGFAPMTTDGAYRRIGIMFAAGELDGSGATDLVAGYAIGPEIERIRPSCDGSLHREILDVTLGTDLVHVLATGDLDDDEIDDIVIVDGPFAGQDVTVLLTGQR
jgi:hypothetical protein